MQVFTTISFHDYALSWVIFFIAALISFGLQLRASKISLSFYSLAQSVFPFEGWARRSTKIDVMMFFAKKLTNRLLPATLVLSSLYVALPLQHLLQAIFPSYSPAEPSILIILTASVILFIIMDFAGYIAHCLEHYVPALWELHKVHHSATFLNPVTGDRVHPFETIFEGLVLAVFLSVPLAVFGFLFGLSMANGLILIANANLIGTIAVLDVLKHSHFPISFGRLDALILSPHMHQAHHSVARRHWDRNFGLKLSVWDWLFGTAVKPAKNEEFVFGLGTTEDVDFERISGVYIGPMVKIFGLFKTTKFRSLILREGAWFYRR